MSNGNATKSITTHVEGRELIMERIFDAPRELVFQAYSESDHLARWWGPKGWETSILTFDFKPGGEWRYCMECKDPNQKDFYGQKSCGLALYHDITTPEKIVHTDSFIDEDGNKLDGMPEMVITMDFIEHEGKTKLVTRTQFATEEVLKQIMDMGVVEGTSSQFEKLDEHLKQIQS